MSRDEELVAALCRMLTSQWASPKPTGLAARLTFECDKTAKRMVAGHSDSRAAAMKKKEPAG
jgi:hypothetical protein